MKRILLFVVTNLAVVLLLSIAFNVVCAVLGIDGRAWLAEEGLNYSALITFALVFGMGGAVISLLMSKPMAKWTTHAQTIDGTEGAAERWLVDTVAQLAERANVKMPEVAIYPGEPNAFATGAFRNHALVAVSTGIMEKMTREELRAVLGHEMSHVANGDMVTMTLVQGVLNACVIFLSRAVAFSVENAMNSGKGRRRSGGGIYYLVAFALEILLGILAAIVVCAYSRRREYAADNGSARLLGTPSAMIAALRRLGNLQPGVLPDSLKAMGISGKMRASLFSTHPPLEARIEALQNFVPS